ncbi:MAG: FHA domain-containing protein [Deltaproteobacteria bacterium]|nr:FHA domain-containing protein [Deltaproteobacteria bacterium]
MIRQKLADTLEKSGQENMVLTADAYGQAYKAVTGEEPPAGWKGMYEGRVLDMMGNVGDAKDLGRVQVTYSGSEPFEFQGVPRDKMKTHFKKDNTTLMVQSVGDPVRPDTATPSRADLAKDQLVLAKELAGSFGLDQNPDFMKDLNALVLKDVSSAGRGLTEKGRTELIGQRMKEARALAERYGLEKNVPFVKLLSRLVVDNLREGEIRFGEAPAKSAESDPALQGFMEKQRGYGLRLVKSFEGKVEPGKRMKFAMDLGKILSADAAGLPTGGDAVLEGKFKDNRQATLEAFAKEYGLDGDAKFMKAAGMILIDSVMKDCPRVEAPPAKVDPAVRKAGTRLEADVYNNALRRGKNLEEAAQLAEQAKGHFDAAIKDGKTPNEAVAIANEKMDADLKQTVRPGAPAPKDPAADEKATVRPGKPKDPTPDQKDTVRPGKPKGPGDVTPSGVRVSDTMTPELQKEVDHLAEGNTPFTAAARDLKAGKITPKEYREAQKAVADKMVADNQAAFEDVMGFLKELGADPDLHLSKEFPAKGRMKAADDLAPKLVRRGWQDASPLTDIAATRIVVESNADVEAVIAKIQQKYTIREAYTKDGEIEADVMTPDEMKAKGIAEEEGVVFIDAKMDKDGIHRLVDGHPASGYRALHVVVEIDGKPVEIQIKTAAMHEWGEIEHKLVYKNKDLPPAVMDPIKQFRKDVADYLAKATHLEPGEKAPEMPKAPELPADAPNRAELQSGLDQMVDLMKKYSGPGGSVDLSGVNIPKAAKAPDVGGIARKAEYELDIFDHVYPPKGGQPEFTDVDITGEINLAAQRLGENGNQALRDKISADLKTLETAPRDSAEYKSAANRLGDMLKLSHEDPRFRDSVGLMSDKSLAEFAKATNDIYEKPDSGAPASNGGKGADVIPFPKRKVDSGFKRAADTDPEGLVAKLDVPDANPKVVLAPMEGIEKGISESNPSLAAKLKADRETVLKGDKESPEYKDALQRLVLLDAALRGPLDYGKGMKPSDLEGFVKPLYEDGPPSSIPPSGDVTKSFATGSGVVLGLLALFSPETARAAEGPLQQIQSSLHIGPVEALMVLGIGTLIGIPMVRKFWGGTKGPSAPPPASRDNPVRIEQDGKTTTIRPFEKRDLKAGGVIDGTIGTISKADSEVVGDSVHLTVEAFDPITGTKKATTMISVSKEEAGRLGIKLNKAGDEIAEVPRQEYLLQDVKTLPQPKLDLAADAAPKDKPVAIVQDGHGQETRIQDLGLFDPTKDSGALRSFGKPTSVEVSKDDPNKVTVRVDVFDPADPNADPTNLAFGIGKPEVVEQRSFTMSKEEAARFGLPLGEPGVPVTVSENKILLLNDKPSDIGSGNALYIPTSNEGGSLIYPAKMAGKKAIAGKIVTVDADRTSVLGDTVYVFFRGMDMPGKKGAAVGTEPIAMSLAEARKLGIALGQGGKLRVENNQFILSDVTRGKDKNVLVDGKAFEGDAAPVSVRLKVGDDGKIQLAGTDGKPLEAPKVDAGMVTGEGANALKIPTAVKVLGPTLAGLLLLADPSIAHASTLDKATSVFTDVLATGGVTMAVLAGLGVMIGLPIMISRSGAESGGPAPQANHPPLPVGDGKTYFQVMADSGGNPVVDQYMGPVTPPLLTFQRGPKGQWYSFEGNPPKQLHESMQDPALSRMWRPVKDGDLFQIGEKIIPFKAPAEAWIQYQMPDGTTTGYAPPAAPPASAPPAIAVSGKLAVGETRTVMPKADGSPFVIGRGQGDLQFTDSSVSGVHATIVRNQADGKWYLVDGPLGDPNKVSTNGIYTLGGRMPKYQAISDGQYFVINGATFQFRAPPEPVAAPKPVAPAPVVAAPVIPLTVTKVQNIDGVTAVVVSGKPYSVRSWTPGWTEMGTMILGRAVSASRVPNDPQGRVRVEVRTRRGAVGDPQEGAITMEMTPGEAADLKIPLRVDGTLDPSAKPPEFSFGEMGPPVALPRAADANPNPVVIRPPAPPPPPPAKGLVEAKDGAGNGYELEPASLGVRMDANKPMGTVLRLEPLPGNSGGKLFLVVEVRSNLRPDADVKTVSFSVTPEEAAKLGLKMDAKGKLAADSNLNLKVKMLEAPLPDIRPLVPGEVQGIWAENKPDAPRRGEVRKDKPTVEYGTAAGKTHEGIGYKDKNEDAVVQGPNWALVLDGMGGHMGGDKASQIASEATAKYLQTHLPSSDPKETLRQALIYGGDAVNATPYGKQGAGAVGVAHLVIKNPDGTYKAVIAHVGDAGAMVVGKDGKIKYRSKDQSLVQAMADSKGVVRDPNNETAELEMRVDPQANVVLGTIGAGHKASPVVEEIPLEPGDRIVMFSDGVSDGTSTKTLARMVTEGKSAQEIQNAIFDSVLTKMADFEDAKNEGMKSGKRLPVTMMNGDTAYIDKRGDIYDSLKDGKLIDHYKADNMTVHVYVHEPASEGGSPGPKGGPDVLGKKAPPPLPAAAKKGTNTVVLKPGSDINYKVIPSENLITPSEMNGLEALNKRPHVAEILHDPNLKPVTKVKVGDQTFYLSRVIETVDEEGNVRPHVLALVPVQENGTTVLKRRFFYKSNSDGGWRASPYMLGGHYAKGVGKHYTQETQPIPELNEQFQILENAGSGVPKVRLKDEDFARYIDAGSPVLDQAAVGTMLGGFKKEIIFPANVGMTDIGGIQPGQAFKAGAYGGASDPAVIPRLANLRYPDGFIPDFKQAPSKTYQENHTLLKTITCREYQGGFLVEKGTGRKRPVIWTMAEDAQGRTWVKSIRYTDSKVNSYGVYDEVIDSGIITSKPLEYAQQSYKLPQQYRPDFDGQYVDITPALNMLKPIREYRQSRGMENPEIPKGMALVPPPPPPVVGPPRVLVSKPLPGFVINSGGANVELKSPVKGLSASQGKWVYQMPSDTSQAFLGRDAFLAQPGTDMVSTKHVRIFRADGTTFIEDSVSSNGTQVIRDGKVSWASRGKGDLMKSIFPLRPGDKIVMGGVEVLFNPS